MVLLFVFLIDDLPESIQRGIFLVEYVVVDVEASCGKELSVTFLALMHFF